ncbi:Fringe glycosyltransferase [Acromyrmex echinatior]|uniref:Fringe glycosyltransferase n=1 Tax=Acromyrmex echinatior TaxID=103372 RepID=F4W509_ACREC|nr:Fringe glycosyltransferase [Acromyrmex echinatior]
MIRVFSFAGRNEDGDAAAWSSMNPKDKCADPAVVEQGSWLCKPASSSPQACTPLAVGAGMMPRSLPTRRGLQALALVIATAYATILLYQAIAPRQWVDEMNVAEVNSRNVIVEVPASRKLINEELPMTLPVATATMAPFTTNLNDVFISVKTTRHYHHSRLPAIIDTWFQFARNQTWFFTDRDDPYFQNQTNGHMINTKCSSSHNRRALCCKMSVEFDRFLDSGRKLNNSSSAGASPFGYAL